jgi:8-oxo-dGTP pyrophosphatase MutT (NUDIX family)
VGAAGGRPTPGSLGERGAGDRATYDPPVALHEYPVDAEDQQEMLAWLDGPRPEPVTARPASTVLLLRERETVEVFVLRRRASMAFAARMHAFPGGGVDPRDSEPGVPWVGPTPTEWGGLLGCPAELAEALVCAAVRELFEECGVLLAGSDHEDVVSDVSGADWESDRLALLDRSLAMSQLLIRRGLRLRSDLLRPWAHWTTPPFESRRYDTWFFVAALPTGQLARDVGGEADHTRWIAVDDLLAGERAGRLPMYPPTQATVAEIVATLRNPPPGHSGVAAVMSAERTLRRVMPWLARDAEGQAVMVVDLDGRGGGRPGPDALSGVGGLP